MYHQVFSGYYADDTGSKVVYFWGARPFRRGDRCNVALYAPGDICEAFPGCPVFRDLWAAVVWFPGCATEIIFSPTLDGMNSRLSHAIRDLNAK